MLAQLEPIDPQTSLRVSGRVNRPPLEPSPAGQRLYDRVAANRAHVRLDALPLRAALLAGFIDRLSRPGAADAEATLVTDRGLLGADIWVTQ